MTDIVRRPAWIARITVRAGVVPRNALDQVLQRPLIARLLALVYSGRHIRGTASRSHRGRSRDRERQDMGTRGS